MYMWFSSIAQSINMLLGFKQIAGATLDLHLIQYFCLAHSDSETEKNSVQSPIGSLEGLIEKSEIRNLSINSNRDILNI